MAAVIFDSCVVLILAGAVISAYPWPFATRLFPLSIGVPILLVALAHLAKDGMRALGRGRDGGPAPEEHIHDIAVDRSVPTRVAAARAGIFFSWILGLFVLNLLIGLKAAIPLYMLLYLKLLSRASWAQCLLLIGILLAFMLGVLDRLLHVPWPQGWFLSLLGI